MKFKSIICKTSSSVWYERANKQQWTEHEVYTFAFQDVTKCIGYVIKFYHPDPSLQQRFWLNVQSLCYETLCVDTTSLHFCLLLHSCSALLLIFCSLSSSDTSPRSLSSGSFNLSFLQPTTAASQSCRPSLMSGPLNCRPWATRSSIRVRPASIWLEDQSTGHAGRTGAGRGSRLCAQVTAF